MNLRRKKSLGNMLAVEGAGEHTLHRTLGAKNLIALGIGAIIGAGLFVRTAAAAGDVAGPAVTLSFIVAAIGCAFAGLCYAEFASMIPIAGSAYAYAYVTMGELVAWIIGWALILEYALGAATVSIAWSEYLNKLLDGVIPYQWCHSPMEAAKGMAGVADGTHGIVNAPALLILFLLTALLIKGTKESATVNAIIVFVKVAIVVVFIAIGWQYVNPANHSPYMIPQDAPIPKAADPNAVRGWFQYGIGGVLRGAGIVFFAFIGFDAVSTAAQETKKPERDMPIGILGSLAVCTVLYILFGHVLTGVANWSEFPIAGKEASVAFAIDQHMPGYHWLATLVTVAILAGFSSVILVMLMGQSRVFYSMAKDGLLPSAFAAVHPKFRTPYKSNIILFFFVSIFAGFIPGDLAGDLTSIGTLFAFVLVCCGIWIMRSADPDHPRPFRTPWVPFVPILSALVSLGLMAGLPFDTWMRLVIWMAIGLVIYFGYGIRHSALRARNEMAAGRR